ncbi:NAD(P)-binding protein [Neoconidiobolus thromboides FSU 785]|nr:NAD(P)-binding protein [Neoconidiobolus thromboides FSU 785]
MVLSSVRVAIIGCGNRGLIYANYALSYPEELKVVAVADPNKIRRENLANLHGIEDNKYIANDWRVLVNYPKFCDAVIIATQDQDHVEPTIAFSNLKYHILLEKPMSNNLKECEMIYDTINKNNVLFAVGHVLRYTPINTKIMELILSDEIGNITSIQHLEPVGYHHFTHSFVRGNWRNEKESSFVLMAKCCHDIDLLTHYLNGRKWNKVSSFGNLFHFKKQNKPLEAGDSKICLECPIKNTCAASAKSIYLDTFETKDKTNYWMLDRISDIIDIENITNVLKNGPYGRCVYECDNDVCDNQVVNIEFEGGINVSFMMAAFTELMCKRKTTIFGDKGELISDGSNLITVYNFLTKEKKEYDLSDQMTGLGASGHGGGDFSLVKAFVNSIKHNDSSYILCDAKQALDSHKLVFAAEKSRLTDKVIYYNSFN